MQRFLSIIAIINYPFQAHWIAIELIPKEKKIRTMDSLQDTYTKGVGATQVLKVRTLLSIEVLHGMKYAQ